MFKLPLLPASPSHITVAPMREPEHPRDLKGYPTMLVTALSSVIEYRKEETTGDLFSFPVQRVQSVTIGKTGQLE